MSEEIVEITEDLSDSPLYSDDLAPIPKSKRSWSTWNLAAIWVGMAVCIPTYLLASYMIRSGMSWVESLIIIGLANLIITVPMVLNGHAGVKYGVPFPVIGRASFGTKGVHIPSIARALVACGWFGIQTWIGGLAIYAIFNAASGAEGTEGLSIGKFMCFGIFWFINMYFIWKGTESIKWLEEYSAPILILMGLLLIGWGVKQVGSFGAVLDQSKQLEVPAASLKSFKDSPNLYPSISFNPLKNKEGQIKASLYQVSVNGIEQGWLPIDKSMNFEIKDHQESNKYQIQFKNDRYQSSIIDVGSSDFDRNKSFSLKIWSYIVWLTVMLGFWATMSLSIADITRYAASQKAQVAGQFIGLPGAMMLYSFVGIFVTFAAVVNFEDILVSNDAPWDPVSLLAKFESPIIVIVSQIFMIIATLSTNIAANVIAPSNAFSNLSPKNINFKKGGTITGIIGIIICPWWLMDEISGILIFVSGLLGPVLGIMLADYFVVRKKDLDLKELYNPNGIYAYRRGFSPFAMFSLIVGVIVAIIGFFVKEFEPLYKLSWFVGFGVSFLLYILLMKKDPQVLS